MKCRICNKDFGQITNTHLVRVHGVTPKEYLQIYPGEVLFKMPEDVRSRLSTQHLGRVSHRKGITIAEEYGEARARSISVRISEARKLYIGSRHPMYGRKQSFESRAKISQSKIGKKNPKISLSRKKFFGDNPDKAMLQGLIMRAAHTEDTGKKISKALLGKKRPNISATMRRKVLDGTFKFSHRFGRSKAAFRPDLGHFVRSTWEANVCRILIHLGKNYKYETKECRFDLGKLGVLVLDLYLPSDNIWIEVKGYLRKESKNKLAEYAKSFPNEASNTKILDHKGYDKLRMLFSDKILGWEK